MSFSKQKWQNENYCEGTGCLQDVEGCESIESISDQLALAKLCCGHSWHVQACDALSGTGLHDGLDWLSRQLVAAGVYDMSA